jgi:hypothetical protein
MGDLVAARPPRRAAASGAAASARALTPAELAWLAAVPCALVVFGLLMLLGPPLGHALLAPRGAVFWPSVQGIQAIRPEPVEHARYLIALLGPVLACAAVAARTRSAQLPPRWTGSLVAASQAIVVVALAVALAAQRLHTYGPIYGGPLRRVYFTVPTLAVALALAGALAIALRREGFTERAGRWLWETAPKRAGAAAVAVAFTLLWLLTAVFFDSSVGHSSFAINVTLPFSIDEAYAVLDGRTPLVDFHAQYGQLWPYVAAIAMSVFGASVTTYTIAMACGTAVVLLSVYATLRRVARSSLGALLLYLPFVATGFFMELGPLRNRYGPENLFTLFPIRYGGPYLLAWLTARQLDGARPRAVPVLFCAAGLVALNNPEFGIAAVGATFAALLWAQAPRSARGAARLTADAAVGLLGALALLSLLTLIRAGSLPHLSLLLEFARLDGIEGWTLVPMPALGFHLAVFLTFAAALVVATVRAAARRQDALLTAMLAWSGIFGLGAGSYFAGRSHPEVLIDLFSSWALAVVFLVVVVVRAARARPSPWRAFLPQLAVLFGFGLCACSIAQFPLPWTQIDRLRDRGVEVATIYVRFRQADRFVAERTHPGERVLILLPVSHRVAYEHGLTNVLPWVSIESMPLVSQFDEALSALRRAHGRKVFLWTGNTWPEAIAALGAQGFSLQGTNDAFGLMEWVRY